MNPRRSDVTLSLAELRQIESICTQFEEAAEQGGHHDFLPWLTEVAPDLRGNLVRELLAIDVELRLRCGQNVDSDDYLDRLHHAGLDWSLEDVQDVLHGAPINDESLSEATPPASSRFEFNEVIGRGGIGEVWRVFDAHSQRPFAIKLLRHRYANDTSARKRFEQEALLTGSLQHPGILPVYDHGVLTDDVPYFAMKLVDGRTFAAILHENRSSRAGSDALWATPTGGSVHQMNPRRNYVPHWPLSERPPPSMKMKF